jgi:hypothetical protein
MNLLDTDRPSHGSALPARASQEKRHTPPHEHVQTWNTRRRDSKSFGSMRKPIRVGRRRREPEIAVIRYYLAPLIVQSPVASSDPLRTQGDDLYDYRVYPNQLRISLPASTGSTTSSERPRWMSRADTEQPHTIAKNKEMTSRWTAPTDCGSVLPMRPSR